MLLNVRCTADSTRTRFRQNEGLSWPCDPLALRYLRMRLLHFIGYRVTTDVHRGSDVFLMHDAERKLPESVFSEILEVDWKLA
jgi:hypothetical protein